MIQIGEYKYKEICAIRGESVKTGKSKQLQLKDWRRYFDWENPTTQIYRITEVYNEPKEKIDNRGGAREGSGAKVKVEEEFDYLFNALLWRDLERNDYSRGGGECKVDNICTSYFTNKEICLYFGFYNSKFYSNDRVNDKKVKDDAFAEVGKKIRDKLNSWVYSKIEKLDVEFTYGIIAYKGQGKNRGFDYKDEWLEDWDKYQKLYLESKKYSGIHQVFDNDKYMEMISFISNHFEGYNTVIKSRKVNFSTKVLKDYEWNDYLKYTVSLNTKLVKELKRYFHKKYYNASDYDYIIDNYVAIGDVIDDIEYDDTMAWLNDI